MATNNQNIEVTPIEDLMREHGILNRLLLIYEEIINRLKNNIEFNIKILFISAMIVRVFVENYHEQTEEKYLFPLFIKSNKKVNEINELIKQHNVGRVLTACILNVSKTNIKSSLALTLEQKQKIIRCLELFIKMYRFHEAYEDTVIFQDIRTIVTKKEYGEMGEKYEEEEDKMFGEGGYEKTLNIIELIEKKLGIGDLHKITQEIEKEIQ
jgi:hemerythrin-like domain-containing protein